MLIYVTPVNWCPNIGCKATTIQFRFETDSTNCHHENHARSVFSTLLDRRKCCPAKGIHRSIEIHVLVNFSFHKFYLFREEALSSLSHIEKCFAFLSFQGYLRGHRFEMVNGRIGSIWHVSPI